MNQFSSYNEEIIYSQFQKNSLLMLTIGIVFIAANLRAPLTSVGPLVNMIRSSLHISSVLTGMITTLPLFAFAFFSPFAPGLARKFGSEFVLFCSIIFLTIGIILRSCPGSLLLFLGTAIIGLAISMGNVLIPSLIKQYFPKQIGSMTGIYTVSMNVFGAMASGISVPIAAGLKFGWTGALRIWAVLGFISIILWIPQVKWRNRKTSLSNSNIETNTLETRREKLATYESDTHKINLWKSPLAWQVTLYMGLQSLIFYCMVAWLPDILIQQGMNSSKAGWMLSLMQLALIPITFIGSVFAGRKANQRSLVIVGFLCVLAGFMGLLFGDTGFTFLWVIILGIGGGFTFSLSMMLFILRTKNADEAAKLSGMAQSMGYLLAAFGPMFFGYLHDITMNWTTPIIVLIGITALCLFTGLGASRNLYV